MEQRESSWTMKSALDAAAEGRLEAWIHGYLSGEGNNQAFSDGLRLTERRYTGPLVFPLRRLERCTGPEETMRYRVDRESFERRVRGIEQALARGFDLPPLIINYSGGRFELNDGNHRYEALTRTGADRFGVIVWTTGNEDFTEFRTLAY